VRHALLAILVILAGLAAALGAGSHRTGALLGVALAGATGLLSILAQGWFAGRGARAVQQALLVNVVGFFLRMLLLVPALFLVVRRQESAAGFVVGFFAVYFALFGIEGAYVLRLGRRTGSAA
jgi:hypothetical protein